MPLLNPAKEDDPIPSNALNVTRVTGLTTLITGLGAALTGIFAVKEADPTALRVAIAACTAAVIVAALFATAIVIAADIRGRTEAATAGAGLKAGDKKADGDGEKEANQKSAAVAATGTQFRVRLDQAAGGGGPYPVLAIRINPTDAGAVEEYLVAKGTNRPSWVSRLEIDQVNMP